MAGRLFPRLHVSALLFLILTAAWSLPLWGCEGEDATTDTTARATTSETSKTTGPVASGAWISSGISDCTGKDVDTTVGTEFPDEVLCTPERNGTVAVCWDGEQYVNGGTPGAWCTYKEATIDSCKGGANEGYIYLCKAEKGSGTSGSGETGTSAAYMPSDSLTEEEREERCDNNRKRQRELEKEKRRIEEQIESTSDEAIARQRAELKSIRTMRADADAVRGLMSSDAPVQSILSRYDYRSKWDECNEENSSPYDDDIEHQLVLCLIELEHVVSREIDTALELKEKADELEQQLREIEKQISGHNTNIAALGCR